MPVEIFRSSLISLATSHLSLVTRFLSLASWIEVISQAVAYEVEGEDAEGYGGGGEDDEVGGFEEVGAGVVEHGSPGGGWGLDAEAEEAEGGFGEDGGGHAYGGLDQEGLEDVGQDVMEHEAEVAGAEGAGGLDELPLFDGEHLGADEAGVVDPAGEGKGEDEVQQAGAEEGDYGDGEEDSWQGEEGVAEVDVDDGVGEASVEACGHAKGDADGYGEGDYGDGDGERDAGTVDGAGEDVAAELVGTEPVAVRRGKETGCEVQAGGVVQGEPGSQKGCCEEQNEKQATGKGEPVAGEEVDGIPGECTERSDSRRFLFHSVLHHTW
jgi:hypothetical protein